MRDVLVIGGGIAGIQASLDLAEMGIHVHLVEKSPSIGGRMAQLDKTFPTNDCSTCILSPKMVDCARHPRITIHTLSEVQAVTGEAGDFTARVFKKARYVDESGCTACGDCAKVCPIVKRDEFQMGLSTRRAIYIPFAQAIPQAYLRNRDDCLGDDPIVCGRCIEACQKQCIDFDMQDEVIELSLGAIILAVGMETFDPVALTEYGYTRYENVITGLEFERLVCASGPSGGHLIRLTDREEPKAIGFIQCVGSRNLKYQRFCSSVCCMHATKEAILAREHIPDVRSYIFYTDLRASGKGFREYIDRAQREYGVEYIRSRVAQIEENGDERLVFHYEDVETSRPQQMKVDLAVLATSLVPGPGVAALSEVLDLELDEYGFFRTNPFSPTDTTREGVLACGCCRGPNAHHVLRFTSLHHTNCSRKERHLMRKVLVIGGGIAGIQAALDLADMGVQVHLVERLPSIGGRMAQLDKTFPTNDCSTCILSPKMNDCARHPNITLHTYAEVTTLAGTAGDFTATVLKHPRYVDETKCTGCGECVQKCPSKVPDAFDMGLRERKAIYLYFPQAVPQVMTIDPDHCIYLQRGRCGACAKMCQAGAIEFEQTAQKAELSVSAVVVATGFEFFDPRGLTQFGYEQCPNVITALEYERLISASGPTEGHLLRPSDRQPAKRIGFIQCVGSRDVRHQLFCSSVCCMHSSKQAVLAAEHDPEVRSYIFYTDFRASGKGFREYVARAEREYGARYVRSRVARITEDKDNNPVIHYENAETSRPARMTVDLAVLATSLIPRPDAAQLAQALGIEMDSYGFVKTDPLAPVDTTRPGVFAAGCCRGPFDIPESVMQASAAAARAARVIGQTNTQHAIRNM